MAGTCYLSEDDDSDMTLFDEDPEQYDDNPPERRMSVHETLGGGKVWQDFGVKEPDRRLQARFGYVSEATMAGVRTKYEATAKPWKWHDHRGGEYMVIIRQALADRIRGHDAFRLVLTMDVIGAI